MSLPEAVLIPLLAYFANTMLFMFWFVYVMICKPDISGRHILLNLAIPFRVFFYY